MGRILTGTDAGCDEGCRIYSLAPWTPSRDHVVRTCTCGIEWEFDAWAAAVTDAEALASADASGISHRRATFIHEALWPTSVESPIVV